MAFQWKIYGKPVEKLWTICGTCMEHDCSGKAMVNLRKTNGQFMERAGKTTGKSMEHLWRINGKSMEHLWELNGKNDGTSMEKQMEHLWKTHENFQNLMIYHNILYVWW